MAGERRAHGVAVVFTEEEDGQAPECGEVHRLVKLPLSDRTIPEEAGCDAMVPLQLVREGQPDSDRQPTPDDGVPPEEAPLGIEEVHRPSPPPAAAIGLAVHLGEDRPHWNAAGEGVAMLAVGRDDCVRWGQCRQRTDGDRLLADPQVEEAADLAGAVALRAGLLEAPDPQHRPIVVEERGPRGLCCPCQGDRVGHGVASSKVERSPSGSPSSRALSNRRMIFPLRVRGRESTISNSFGAIVAPSR